MKFENCQFLFFPPLQFECYFIIDMCLGLCYFARWSQITSLFRDLFSFLAFLCSLNRATHDYCTVGKAQYTSGSLLSLAFYVYENRSWEKKSNPTDGLFILLQADDRFSLQCMHCLLKVFKRVWLWPKWSRKMSACLF